MNGWVKPIAAAMWTVVGAFGIVGTWTDDIRLMLWSVLFAIASAVVTGYIIAQCAVRRERLRIERIIEGLVAAARREEQGAEVRSIR